MTTTELKYREDRGRWEIYIPPHRTEEMNMYLYCIDTFGLPASGNGWDQHGGWYMFTNTEYVTMVKLRFGL